MERRPGTSGAGKGKAPRVLIVDDDPAMRMLCSINLQIEGLLVLEAADGRRGLEQARAHRPDLVVTDVMMPGLNGFQFAEALRQDERTRQIPLIFISAETEPANAARAHKLGALAYLTKPFDPPALASLVTRSLDRGTSNTDGMPNTYLGGVSAIDSALSRSPQRHGLAQDPPSAA